MTDTCRVYYIDRSADPTRDEATTAETFPEVPVWAGKCKVQRYDGQTSREDLAGGREITSDRLYVHVPVTAAPMYADYLIELLTSATQPLLVGRVFIVRSDPIKSRATARRMTVEEVTG